MQTKCQDQPVLYTEAEIWKYLHIKRRGAIDAQWLLDQYSMDISQELRTILCEKLGQQQDQGWNKIKILINRYGIQRELIHAAGLCHQKEAFSWLLSLIFDQNEVFYCDIAESLACWGAEIPDQVLMEVMLHDNPKVKIAGLSMLNFRSYQLSAEELLDYCELALENNQDVLNLEVVRLLQKRDEPLITERLFKLCSEGSDATVNSALKALVCINSSKSRECLRLLTDTLVDHEQKEFALKQLSQQCETTSQD